MPAFDFVVVGCGGGPSETDLSAYLVKPHDSTWEEGILGIEAGSGLGALRKVVKASPSVFGSRVGEDTSPQFLSAPKINSFIQSYLISHAHLDHVNGLVLSAGSSGGSRKRVYGTPASLKTLESIFSDRAWPKLASWDEDDGPWMLLYSKLDLERYQNVGCGISVRTMPISHGHNETVGTYESAAFFVRHDASLAEFLFFGDVEPDSVSLNPRNAAVWAVAAEKIAQGVLNTIFIECSWPSGRPDAQLYGHLTPDHLVVELGVLAAEVVRCRQEKSKETAPASDKRSSSRPARKRRRTNASTDGKLRTSLRDVRVYVIHCKDDLEERYDQPIAHIITNQIKDQVEEKGLGVTVIAAEQGMHITF